jgi:signal transduction histidine kinase
MDQNDKWTADQGSLAFLAGGGEMGERTRIFDWSATPVGPVSGWPQSLKTVVRILLDSRYAMWLGWGPDFTFFYNDAYAKMTLGPKHPWALGRSAREVWSEIWGDSGPRAESVIRTGQATWDEGLLLFLERLGFPEETYHTFSYSPVPDDRGGVGGMLCVVTEDTERTIGERRLRTLRELAARTTDDARSAEDASRSAALTLAGNRHDLPFVLLYLLDAAGRRAQLVGLAGLGPDTPASPPAVDLEDQSAPWPFRRVAETGKPVEVSDLPDKFGALPGGAWPESPRLAVVLPMAKPGQARLAGFVVAGASPRLAYTDAYRGFLDLLAGHVATAVANARAYEEERRRAEALAELDRAKTAFFSNVSHEFRTPLTLMLGPVEELLARSHTNLSPAAAVQLEIVNRNGMRLLRLVNTLLDFSRIEAGRVRAVHEPTDLAGFTAELASVFRAAVERAGLRLVVECPRLPEPVLVDREMWEKVVLNLLSNAFKFTLDGEIAVSLRQVGRAAELRVRDTGIGIPQEALGRIFEMFSQVDRTMERSRGGLGIGLTLVKRLVEMPGGRIEARSDGPGQGSTFTLRLPVLIESSRPDPQAKGSEEAAPRSALRILIVDDNRDSADSLAMMLRIMGNDTRTAHDGLEAVAVAEASRPDVVLLDIGLPKLNGYDTCRRIREHPWGRCLVLIAVTGWGQEEDVRRSHEAGFDRHWSSLWTPTP